MSFAPFCSNIKILCCNFATSSTSAEDFLISSSFLSPHPAFSTATSSLMSSLMSSLTSSLISSGSVATSSRAVTRAPRSSTFLPTSPIALKISSSSAIIFSPSNQEFQKLYQE